MNMPKRPVAYVLAATNHGSMIVNRHDWAETGRGDSYGVGHQLLNSSSFDSDEIELALGLLSTRRDLFGPGVVAIDGGANLGVHTLSWARHMHGWGSVIAFEAQEYLFYALAGNVAINNCWNAKVRWAALGEKDGQIHVPEPDYLLPGSFGSLEARQRATTEFIGQSVSYAQEDCIVTAMVSIDSLQLPRLDFLKLDVEGMELDVLHGARATIARCRPIVLAEIIKSDLSALQAFLSGLGYAIITEGMGLNLLAIHAEDPTRGHLRRA